MEAEENSPNFGWKKIGYKIERRGPTGGLRTIKDQNGKIVLKEAGYSNELEWLVSREIIIK